MGRPVSGADSTFYLHEPSESTMMRGGIPYDAAHVAVLQKYGVWPFSLYHPDVIRALPEEFGTAWKTYWGIQ